MSEDTASQGPVRATDTVSSEAHALVRRLVEAGAGRVRAVLLYGSQLLRTRPDRHSAFDLVVIVDAYRPFYRGLREAGELHRPVWLMTGMARVLPPNTIAFAPEGAGTAVAKCLIVDSEDLTTALGDSPRDHFFAGRLVQRVAIVWTRRPEDARWVDELLAGARERVLAWTAPYLEGSFDARRVGRRLLEVSYGAELRPEAKDRVEQIFQAQADHFEATLPVVLERGVASGRLERDGEHYRLAGDVPSEERRRWHRYFARSKLRATARWLKHMVTFSNWLPYVVRKVERHTGRRIELTLLERKLPIVFLWPRAIHVLLTRPDKGRDG